MKTIRLIAVVSVCAVLLSSGAIFVLAQRDRTDVHDPGPRGAPVLAGEFLPGTTAQLAQAQDGKNRFVEAKTVPSGFGPFYNGGAIMLCGECHSQPAIGGSSPSVSAYPFIGPNPQATVDFNADGAKNSIPPFITADGPVREMRLKYFHNPDGSLNLATPDGGVHDLFSVTERLDTPQSCTLAQPNFEHELALSNAGFRIPLPLFGDGLIENIDDATILANQAANAAEKAALGISGIPNRNGNDNTITRFGWKAQNKSIVIFAAEAAVVEIGLSNELFPTKRPPPGDSLPAACKITATPDDTSNPENIGPAVNGLIPALSAFIRMLAPPTPALLTPSAARGKRVFLQTGCALCHTPSMTTAKSSEFGLSEVQANLFSDLLVHNMGTELADGITQGLADGNHFRTPPLWGLGQRVFFLHDGRATNLLDAIKEHASPGSEANAVIQNFNHLRPRRKQDLLNFLRSL